jgi:hypothetical protein
MFPPQNFLRDNPVSDRAIEDGTKALRRGLMSGETLRAPRQQLRPLLASAFVFIIQNFVDLNARAFRRVFFFGV